VKLRMSAGWQAFLAVVFWGISFVATRAALRELSPLTLVATRAVLGTTLLAGITAWRREPLVPPAGRWSALALMGFVGVFFHQWLQAQALTMTTAVRTGWLIGLIPIWSAILAALFLRERFGALKLLGLALGFLGAVIVVTRGRFDPHVFALPSTRGDLLVLASTLNWALYTILSHGTIRRVGSVMATAGSMFFGAVFFLPLFLWHHGWTEYAHLTPVGVLAVLFLGIGCSGIAYLLWYAALGSTDAGKVSAFLYLEPLVTLAAAVALLGEEVGMATVLGGLVVLAGVALVQRAPAARATTPVADSADEAAAAK
jgi:drug/metabolite transporter (DMT)-like permease